MPVWSNLYSRTQEVNIVTNSFLRHFFLTSRVISVAFYIELENSRLILLRGSNFGLRFFYVPWIYDNGSTALLSFGRNSYSGFLRSEKFHRPRPGLDPRTPDPVSSMITTGPPERTTNSWNIGYVLTFRYKVCNVHAMPRMFTNV